jgi:hypothetical protein
MAAAEDLGTEDGKHGHPEIKKLRKLQQIEASQVLDNMARSCSTVALAVATTIATTSRNNNSSAKKKRQSKSSARFLLPHCGICGGLEHKRTRCPYKDSYCYWY